MSPSSDDGVLDPEVRQIVQPEEADPDDLEQRGHPTGYSARQQDSYIPKGWTPTFDKPLPVVRCVHTKRDGDRCGRWSVRGLEKCIKHCGWNFPHVRERALANQEAARMRIFGLVPDALDALEHLVNNSTSDAVQLRAAETILDRSGLRGGSELNVTVTATDDPAEVLRVRMATLKQRALAAASASPSGTEVLEGELVDDTVDETPHPEPEET